MSYTLSGFTQEQIEDMYQQMIDDTLPEPETELSQEELDKREIMNSEDVVIEKIFVMNFLSAKIFESPTILKKRLIISYEYAQLIDKDTQEPFGCAIVGTTEIIQTDLTQPLPDFVHEITCSRTVDRLTGLEV